MHYHLDQDYRTAAKSWATGPVALVAGGAGFLGSHLCHALIGRGYSVVCLDNFHTGRASNLAGLAGSSRFAMIEHDVVAPVPADLPIFDEIYNLACPASPPHYQSDPLKTAMTCALGTLNLLERARRDGARMLHASTSEIYGDPLVHPQAEAYLGNVNTTGPRACYDEGKRFGETLCRDFARAHGTAVKIVRIFNTYGPRMQPDDGRVVSNFIVQALKGEPLSIYGDGEQTRSFCYVDDLIAGFLAMMDTPDDFYGPVNLGNPAEVTVAHLANVVIALTASTSEVAHHPRPVDDPCRRRPDISLAESVLEWSPQVDLLIGLERTIEYFSRLRTCPRFGARPAQKGLVLEPEAADQHRARHSAFAVSLRINATERLNHDAALF